MQPDLKPLPLLKPWQKTPEQENMMRRRHGDPCPPRPLAPRPQRTTPASPRHAHLGPMAPPKGNQQPDLKALAPPEALTKDTRAKEHDAAKARGPMPPAAIGTTPPTHHTRLTSTRAPRPHGAPQGQSAARSEAPALPEALAKNTRAKEHDAVKAIGPMPLAAIGTTPPTNYTCLTSTRAPRPHGTPQGQPAARSEASAPPEALAKDTRAKGHDAAKARGTHAPRGHRHHAPHAPHPPHLDTRTSAPWYSPRATGSPI